MRFVSIGLLLGLLASCQKAQNADGSLQGPGNDIAVASYAGRTISLSALEKELGYELFEFKSRAAHDMVLSELLETEAKRRNKTLQELLEAEVDGKVGEATEAEIDELLAKARAEKTMPEGVDEPTMRGQLREVRKKARKREREQEYYAELMRTANVRIFYDALGRPPPQPLKDAPRKGGANAKVEIHEYVDFEAPFTSLGHRTLVELSEKYQDRILIVFRQNPDPKHPAGFRASQAALCAHRQGKYWEYRAALLQNQGRFQDADLIRYAQDNGLKGDAFTSCLTNGETAPLVRTDMKWAADNGIQGSPAFSLNGTRLSGAHSSVTFSRIIDIELRTLEGDKLAKR
jgi:predicted DsbA family dithiol-disulfide isomerase